jgi:ribosomal protein S12 methylthiotransferase
VGTEVEVLVERVDAAKRTVTGRTEADAPEVDGTITVSGVLQARVGAVVRARVTAADGYDLVGAAVGATAANEPARSGRA